nr:hypothetical protein [uncultured Draconibacterium sp.]
MVIAKLLRAQDNKSFMHREYPIVCGSCGYPLKQVVCAEFKLNKRNMDVSYTWDGYLIVSERFVKFCNEQGYSNASFEKLQKEPQFYWFNVEETIALDYKKRGVQFLNLCKECNNYAEVIGAAPSFISDLTMLDEKSFYKSEYSFGSFERKTPLILLGTNTAKELTKQIFKGLYFKDVLQS